MIYNGPEFIEKVLKGIEKAYEAIIPSYGPSNKNAIIQLNERPVITQDGATIIESIVLPDRLEDLGVKLLQVAVHNTLEKNGDGTSLTTILTYNFLKEFHSLIVAGEDVNIIVEYLKKFKNDFIDYIRHEAESIKSEKDLFNVVFNSCRDMRLTETVVKAASYTGDGGYITIEEGYKFEDEIKFTEGYHFSRGLIRPEFINKPPYECELRNPLILVYNDLIYKADDMLKILSFATKGKRDLLIIAKDVYGPALHLVLSNINAGLLRANIIRPPSFGETSLSYMQDIAKVVGGVVVNPEAGYKLHSISMFGSASFVISNNESTTIIGGAGEDTLSENEYVNILQQNILHTKDEDSIKILKHRIALLNGGIATIFVGGQTETEVVLRKAQAEDAISTMKSALNGGIIPSIAMFLYDYVKKLDSSESYNKLLKRIFIKPIEIIYSNNWMDYRDVLVSARKDYGYDFQKDKLINIRKNGLMDSASVLIDALENSISIVSTVIRGNVGIIK